MLIYKFLFALEIQLLIVNSRKKIALLPSENIYFSKIDNDFVELQYQAVDI